MLLNLETTPLANKPKVRRIKFRQLVFSVEEEDSIFLSVCLVGDSDMSYLNIYWSEKKVNN